ncbi:MAG: YbaK/EbsC family protein [Thermoanaerobaculia bacterium]
MTALDPEVQRQLDVLGVIHEVLACDPELADTDAFCSSYDIPRDHAANTIIVVGKGDPRRYFGCLVLATTKIDANHRLSALVGIRRLSFAAADETRELSGQAIGGVTVFGLPDSIPLIIDSAVMDRQWVIVGGGNRSSKIRVAPGELLKIPGARVAEIAVPRT